MPNKPAYHDHCANLFCHEAEQPTQLSCGAVTRYRDIALGIARRIHSGDLASGTELPSVRELAREHGTTASTVTRAYRHLADGDVIVLADRRPARVPPTGRVAAARFLDSDRVFRLAASDDPALRFLLDAATAQVSTTSTSVGRCCATVIPT
jgi:DNA-binding transcriptional MocR family regulator